MSQSIGPVLTNTHLQVPIDLWKAITFAADAHRDQRRNDSHKSPYINHCLGVAAILSVFGEVTDLETLQAAVLHDSVEDVGVTFEQLEAKFGRKVRDIVAEVTDDKSLGSVACKRAQIEHVAHMSNEAKLVKMADKLYNLNDLKTNIPPTWEPMKAQGFFVWSKKVVGGIKGLNAGLEAELENMWAAKIKLWDGTEIPAIPTVADLDAYLEEYYAKCCQEKKLN